MLLIGSYYIEIKDAYIKWGELRKTSTRAKRKEESNITIPTSYVHEEVLSGFPMNSLWQNSYYTLS